MNFYYYFNKIHEVILWYGIRGAIRLLRDYLYTKIFYSNARLIRLPVYIRGIVEFHDGFTSGVGLRIDVLSGGNIKFGNNIKINDYVHIAVSKYISIGNNCLIASKVFISDHNHGDLDGDSTLNSPNTPPGSRPLSSNSILIGDNVWIGENVCILPGVIVGNGVIIGSGTILTKSVPSNCVIVGSPPKIIRRYDEDSGLWIRVKNQFL